MLTKREIERYREHRRKMVAKMRSAGHTYATIGAILEVSKQRAWAIMRSRKAAAKATHDTIRRASRKARQKLRKRRCR